MSTGLQGQFCGRHCFCGPYTCSHCSEPTAGFFQGICFLAGAQKVITDLTAPSQRADALGKLGLCFGIGIIIGSALGGILSTKFGWVICSFGVGLAAAIEGTVKGYFSLFTPYQFLMILFFEWSSVLCSCAGQGSGIIHSVQKASLTLTSSSSLIFRANKAKNTPNLTPAVSCLHVPLCQSLRGDW